VYFENQESLLKRAIHESVCSFKDPGFMDVALMRPTPVLVKTDVQSMRLDMIIMLTKASC
jgi:hypothetical protein